MESEMVTPENLPLALRRPRRSNAGTREQDTVEKQHSTPSQPSMAQFKTPRKKKVRFSEPGPSATGLTPMIRRTTIGATPSSSRRASTGTIRDGSLHHRVSTPAALKRCTSSSSSSSSAQHAGDSSSLHQTVDGRVERRLRRSALRSHLQKLDDAHQRSEQKSRSQISLLRSELRVRDREIYELQNATMVVDTDRVCDLEQQIDELQARLREAEQRKQRNRSRSVSSNSSTRTSVVEWTMAARDPFEEQNGDMDLDMDYDAGDEDVFGDATVAQFTCSTPTRARADRSTDAASSFPTPPATSPCELPPSTPSRLRFQQDDVITPMMTSAGTQAQLPDLEKEMQIESLHREMDKLTSSLDTYKNLMERLNERVPRIPSREEEEEEEEREGREDSTMEPRIEHVLCTLSDRTAALTELTSSVTSLGFLGTDATEMLASIASGFRTARLELEYLTPGEITLPLTAHGAEVLDLLLVRLRELARKAKEGDDAVDEYHAIELNLRQQLEARVLAMDDLRDEVKQKQKQLDERSGQVEDLEVGNDRLKGAVTTYIRDIRELERLVEKLEGEAVSKDTTIEQRDAMVADLEERLGTATVRASDLQDELEVAQASRKKHLASVNRRSGEALALRDARVTELREEIDRINEALRDAHYRIRSLRVNADKLEVENDGLRAVVDGMKAELKKAEVLRENRNDGEDQQEEQGGKYLSGGLARRASGKKRRRPDSGLGFLDEEEVDA